MSYLFPFTLLVLSPWPIFFSYLLYYWATLDSSYNPIIYSKKILYKHWIFLAFIVLICSTIFVFRLGQIGREIDFLNTISSIWELFTFLPYYSGYLLFLSLIIIGIFWFLLLSRFYTYIRRSCIVLFVYYDQFDGFRKFVHILIKIRSNSNSYLEQRARKFFEPLWIWNMAFLIWPYIPKLVERNLFRFLIPYLYIFDICVKNGMVSLVFYVLPWMFIYTVVKSFYKLFWNIFRLRLFDVTIFLYGLDTDSEEDKIYYK